jgi:hypothetical protein
MVSCGKKTRERKRGGVKDTKEMFSGNSSSRAYLIVDIGERPHQELAVEPIHHAAVAGDQVAEVLERTNY